MAEGKKSDWQVAADSLEESLEVMARANQAVGRAADARSSQADTSTALTTRLRRLRQFQGWIEEDPEFERFVDGVIQKRVQAATRKQTIIAVIVAILSLAAGWLLNAINPLSLLPH